MRRLRRVGIGVAVATILSGGHAGAQSALTEPRAIASTSPASPHALELAKRMIRAVGMEKQIDTVVTAMLPTMVDQPAYRGLPPEARKLVLDTVLEALREDFTPKMIDRITPIYASTFSEPELEAIVAFYESPTGQSLLSKTPVLAQSSASLVRELMPEMQAEVARRLCEKLACATGKKTTS